MTKLQAFFVTTTGVLISAWFGHWLTFTLSGSSFLAFMIGFIAVWVSSVPTREVQAHARAVTKLGNQLHHLRPVIPFNQYKEFLPLLELATLWTLALIAGNIVIFFYLYQLIPLVSPLELHGWDRVVVLVYTAIGGAVLSLLYSLGLNWALTDKAVRDFEERGDLGVFSTVDNELKQQGVELTTPQRAFALVPSALLFVVAALLGYYLNHVYGALLALIAVHSLLEIEIPVTWVTRSQVYGGATALTLGAALVLAHPESRALQLLTASSVLLMATITACTHERARLILPLYWRGLRALLWGVVGVLWVTSAHPFPALVCLLFSIGNLISLLWLIARRFRNATTA